MQQHTLYCGDLSPLTLESDLFKLFASVGGVSSIKIVRSNEPGLSCYAYVNFDTDDSAKQALASLNFSKIHGKEIRLVPFLKKNENNLKNNIIVKNLPDDIDNKTLFDTFRVFGPVLSAKIVTVDDRSLCFGYVLFADKLSAKKAVKYADGSLMKGNKLKVERHLNKDQRASNKDKIYETFTNVFIKNFPLSVSKEKLYALLSTYGEITSFYFPYRSVKENESVGDVRSIAGDMGGAELPVGIAFCNFCSNEVARDAITGLHDTNPFDHTENLYVQRAQPKAERVDELQQAFRKMTLEGRSFKRNLYVTNIPEEFSEKDVREVFEGYGEVVGVKIGPDSNIEKRQYAYVCYANSDDAGVAVEKGNELYFAGKKLTVSYFKNKIERKNKKSTLYEVILKLADSFEHSWEKYGVKTNEEFAKKMSKHLLQRNETEMGASMFGIEDILNANINEVLKKNK